jgi:hypothetical protein
MIFSSIAIIMGVTGRLNFGFARSVAEGLEMDGEPPPIFDS